jgi:hypothetical protein
MKAFVFPGQGAQFVGMGKDLYDNNALAKELFEKANEILGYRITDIMFEGTDEELTQTKVTQPAVFLHSVISALCMGDNFQPTMVAGHSLGEFSALVAAGALSFEDGLKLVYARAMAMQKACEIYDLYRADRVLSEDDRADFIVMMQDRNHPVDAMMAVSGLTIALIEYAWSKERFALLLQGYYESSVMMVRERIFVGLLLAMIKNNSSIREAEDLWDTIQDVLTGDAEMSFTALCNIARTSQVKYLEQFNKNITKDLLPLMDQVGSDEFYDAIRKHQSEMERIALMSLDQNFLIFKASYISKIAWRFCFK